MAAGTGLERVVEAAFDRDGGGHGRWNAGGVRVGEGEDASLRADMDVTGLAPAFSDARDVEAATDGEGEIKGRRGVGAKGRERLAEHHAPLVARIDRREGAVGVLAAKVGARAVKAAGGVALAGLASRGAGAVHVVFVVRREGAGLGRGLVERVLDRRLDGAAEGADERSLDEADGAVEDAAAEGDVDGVDDAVDAAEIDALLDLVQLELEQLQGVAAEPDIEADRDGDRRLAVGGDRARNVICP